MKQIALASKSPRRSDILHKAGIEFHLVKSDYNEELDNKIFSYKKIETLAKNKAFGALANLTSPAYVLSADTVVVSDNKILTKYLENNKWVDVNTLSINDSNFLVDMSLFTMNNNMYLLTSDFTNIKLYKFINNAVAYWKA